MTAALQLQIRCGSISLGWLQPPELRDVQVYDSGTEVLLELRRLRIDRPLWRLLQNPHDLGQIELQQPVLHLRCYPGGSNLEDLVQRLPRTSGSSVGLQGDFAIRDGTLSVSDTLHDRCWKLTGWQAQLRLPAAGGQPLSLQTSLQADHAAGPSTLTARVWLTADTGTEGPIETDVQLQLQQFPAAVAQLLATRLAYEVELDGVLDGQLQGQWRTAEAGAIAQLAGQLTAGNLSVQSPAWGGDRLEVQQAQLSLDVQVQANTLHVHQLKLVSDVGDLQIDGQFDRQSLVAFNGGTAAGLPTRPCQITGSMDLARLAQMAPRTLHVRDDTRLTAGRVHWDLACCESDGRPCWQGNLEASQLQAEQDGRAVGIDRPLRLSLRLTQMPEGIRVDELVGQSTFLALRGQGQAMQGQIAWRADLSRLQADLGQLVDWRGLHLAGQLEGHLGWQSTAGEELQAQGGLKGSRLQVVYGDRVDLQEAELQLDFAARGRLLQRRLHELSSAQLQFRSAGDQLSAHLTEPVVNPRIGCRWPLQLHCSGQLASWRQRLQGLVPGDLPQVNGQLDAETQLQAELTEAIHVSSARVTVQQLEVLAADRQAIWTEPLVRVRASGRYAPPQGQIELDSLEVKTSATELQATGTLQDLMGQVNVRLAGQVGYDLPRWSTRMRPVWGDHLQLIGRVTQPFTLEGPCRQSRDLLTHPVSTAAMQRLSWIPEGLTARLGFGWEAVRAWGFDLDAGSLQVQLQRQRISVDPVSLPVSGGQLHLAPHIRWGSSPVLEMDPGLLIDKVQISPEMCRGWLQYLAPLLANATQAEGLFSVELADARLPLNRPRASSVNGTLSVHSARVGPGPLTRQLLSLTAHIHSILDPSRAASGSLDPASTWVVLPAQRVPFRLEGGRVWHEGLTMLVGDLPVQTSGWVTFEEQLALWAEIPVQEKWLGNQSLAGRAQGPETPDPNPGHAAATAARPTRARQLGPPDPDGRSRRLDPTGTTTAIGSPVASTLTGRNHRFRGRSFSQH